MELVGRLARHPIIRQQGKFLVVALVAAIVDFGLANVLAFVVDVDTVVASGVALCLASAVNFALNRSWTFDRHGKVDLVREVVPFALVALVVLGMTSAVVWLAGYWFGKSVLIFNAARVTGLGLMWLAKFFVFRQWVFVDRGTTELR